MIRLEHVSRQWPEFAIRDVSLDVEEGQLVHRETVGAAGETLDELGRVRAAGADDRDLHTHRPDSVHSQP